MSKHRMQRVDSLLTEVLSEVVMREVKDPRLPNLITITKVETSNDLHYAKVYFSVIGGDQEKKIAQEVLDQAAGYIAIVASKKVVLRYFPALTFKLDTSIEKHTRIDEILSKIQKEQNSRNFKPTDDNN